MDKSWVKIFPEFYILIGAVIFLNLIGVSLDGVVVSFLKESGWYPVGCKINSSPNLVFTSAASIFLSILAMLLNVVFFARNRNFAKIGEHVIKIKTGSKVIGLIACSAFFLLFGKITIGNDCEPGRRFGEGVMHQIVSLSGSLIFGLFLFMAICFLAGLANDENIVNQS